MREIPLSKGKVTIVGDEDFEFLSQWKWYFNSGYAVRGCPQRILMHRVILNTPEGAVSDHINRNKLDNRRCNLRVASVSLNNFNTKLRIDNTSGIKGIYWSKEHSRWRPFVCLAGKRIYFGLYDRIEDAIMAREARAGNLYV